MESRLGWRAQYAAESTHTRSSKQSGKAYSTCLVQTRWRQLTSPLHCTRSVGGIGSRLIPARRSVLLRHNTWTLGTSAEKLPPTATPKSSNSAERWLDHTCSGTRSSLILQSALCGATWVAEHYEARGSHLAKLMQSLCLSV